MLFSFKLGDILIEEGAQWIHGGPQNPINRIADKLNMLTNEVDENLWGNLYLKNSLKS